MVFFLSDDIKGMFVFNSDTEWVLVLISWKNTQSFTRVMLKSVLSTKLQILLPNHRALRRKSVSQIGKIARAKFWSCMQVLSGSLENVPIYFPIDFTGLSLFLKPFCREVCIFSSISLVIHPWAPKLYELYFSVQFQENFLLLQDPYLSLKPSLINLI